MLCISFFFFKQKTAYDMRISDWSSDVCSSDLAIGTLGRNAPPAENDPRRRRALELFFQIEVPVFGIAVERAPFIAEHARIGGGLEPGENSVFDLRDHVRRGFHMPSAINAAPVQSVIRIGTVMRRSPRNNRRRGRRSLRCRGRPGRGTDVPASRLLQPAGNRDRESARQGGV